MGEPWHGGKEWILRALRVPVEEVHAERRRVGAPATEEEVPSAGAKRAPPSPTSRPGAESRLRLKYRTALAIKSRGLSRRVTTTPGPQPDCRRRGTPRPRAPGRATGCGVEALHRRGSGGGRAGRPRPARPPPPGDAPRRLPLARTSGSAPPGPRCGAHRQQSSTACTARGGRGHGAARPRP